MTEPAEQVISASRASAWSRAWITRWVSVACYLLIGLRVLSVQIIGYPTNDSLHYLTRSHNLSKYGFVAEGYRQIGYPAFLKFTSGIARLTGWDHIFVSALVQRLVFAAALVVIAWALGRWSIPLLFVATSATVVGLTQFIVTEAVTTSLVLMLAGVTIAATTTHKPRSSGQVTTYVVVSCALVVVLACMKIQFAPMMLLPAWIVVSERKETGTRATGTHARGGPAAVAIATLIVCVIVGGQTVENRRDLGVTTPIGESALATAWGAWNRTFTTHKDYQTDPRLGEYTPRSSLYAWLGKLRSTTPKYSDREAAVNQWVDKLYKTVGTTPLREHAQSAFDGLLGGGLNDTSWFFDTSNRLDRSAYDSPFSLAKPSYRSKLLRLNGGRDPAIVTLGPIAHAARGPYDLYTILLGAPMLAAWAVCLLSAVAAFKRAAFKTSVAMLLALGCVVAIVLMLATSYIDLQRYLAGAMLMVLAFATLSVRTLVTGRASQAAEQSQATLLAD